MIHYHGTPLTPRAKLLEMSGRHFCVSFAHPCDIEICLDIGQSVMLDNGAFSAFTKGKALNEQGFYDWCEKHLTHPHWAVVPDVIDGSVELQREKLKPWPFPKELSAPVWHLGLSIDWLLELADHWPKICFGSSGEYWQVGSPKWEKRMDEAFEALCRTRKFLPWIHGMRMLSQSDGKFPLASADSVNVARNFKDTGIRPDVMAARIDARQPARKWKPSNQIELGIL
ncbi:hypothetical protein EB118_18035 [bacterium]|nr:hypothetical protein [bacterium]